MDLDAFIAMHKRQRLEWERRLAGGAATSGKASSVAAARPADATVTVNGGHFEPQADERMA